MLGGKCAVDARRDRGDTASATCGAVRPLGVRVRATCDAVHTHYLLLTAYYLQLTTYYLTTYSLQLTAYCLLLTAYCLLPTAYCPLPTTYSYQVRAHPAPPRTPRRQQ